MHTNTNSRTVTIFRAGSFLSRAQGKEIEDFFSTSKRAVGSYWESVSSKRIGSGLSFKEEEILLPLVIDVDKTDREFRKKVTEFYVNLETQVPHGQGKTLEIGLEDNSKPLSEKNLPIDVMDYIRYRHAIKHPYVASSKEQSDGNALMQFYIFDKSEVTKQNTKKQEEKDAAMQLYLEIKMDLEKVDTMLTLLAIDPREFSGPNADELKIKALREQAETKPKNFIEIYNEGDLKIRYWIKTMINTGVLKNIGTKHLDAETNKLIGNNLEETMYYFKDELNSDMVVALKSKAQEALKRPIKRAPSMVK